MLNFPEDYFKREVRCDFVVSEVMKRNWAAQIEILMEIDALCKRHDIVYHVNYGTLLGAVRHKGFIPWDDDIDIAMEGKEYIRFLYYAAQEIKGEYRLLNSYTTEDWGENFSRITNGSGLMLTPEHLEEWHGCPLPVGLDIFPYYYLPRREEEKEAVIELLGVVDALLSVDEYVRKKEWLPGMEGEREELNLTMAENLVLLQNRTGYQFNADKTLSNQLWILYDQISRLCEDEESDYVTLYNEYLMNPNFKVKKEIFRETVELPFENIIVPAPKDYDTILRVMYGDYHVPVKGTAWHDYPYFGKQFRHFKNSIEIADMVQRRKDMPNKDFEVPGRQELQDSQNEKCVVLFYTGVREMLIYSEYVIDKIRQVLKTFEDHSDHMELWWMPGRFTYPGSLAYAQVAPELAGEYQKLIEETKTKNICICDESGDISHAIDHCDCYYGDESFLSDMFKMTGKPVLIQDYRLPWNETVRADQKIGISFEQAVSAKQDICYGAALNLNGLFEIDRENNVCRYIAHFPKEKANGKNLYSAAVSCENKILFVPYAAEQIAIFDIAARKISSVALGIDDQSGNGMRRKFGAGVREGKNVYLICSGYSYIVRVNMDTYEVEKIDIGIEGVFWENTVLREGNIVSVPAQDTNQLLQFNVRTERVTIRESYDVEGFEFKLQKAGISVSTPLAFDEFERLDEFWQDAFSGYEKEGTTVIREEQDWITLFDVESYVTRQKGQR